MEAALSLTPGLGLFLQRSDIPPLVNTLGESTAWSTFYTVTVLSLIAQIPLSVIVSWLLVIKLEWETDEGITAGALWWLLAAIMSVALLLVNIMSPLPLLFHLLLVTQLLVGTILRLVGVVGLPVLYYMRREVTIILLWWWLTFGLDWPSLMFRLGFFMEIAALWWMAQVLRDDAGDGAPLSHGHAAAVFAVPMFLRCTGITSPWWMVFVSVPLFLFCIIMVVYRGCALNPSRVIDETFAAVLPAADESKTLEEGSRQPSSKAAARPGPSAIKKGE